MKNTIFCCRFAAQKKLSIADGFDPAVLDPACLSAYFRGNGELVLLKRTSWATSINVDLRPGRGVHIHRASRTGYKNGDAGFESRFGILWYSDVTARRRYLYRVKRLDGAGWA